MLDLPNNQMRSELLFPLRDGGPEAQRGQATHPGPQNKQEAELGLTLGLSSLAGRELLHFPCDSPLLCPFSRGFGSTPLCSGRFWGSMAKGRSWGLDGKLSRPWRILTPCTCPPESGHLRGPVFRLPEKTFVAWLRWAPLGPRCHRQRAPAAAQVRARAGGSFPGFQRNTVGSHVWKLPPRGSREAPSPCLSAQVSLTFHPRSCSAPGESDFLGVGVRKPGVSPC